MFVGYGSRFQCFVCLLRRKRYTKTAGKLSATDALYNDLYVKQLLRILNQPPVTMHPADSISFRSLSTSTKEPKERYNKKMPAAGRKAFHSGPPEDG